MHGDARLSRRAILAGAFGVGCTAGLPLQARTPGGLETTAMRRWYPDYQTRDQEIIEYHEFSVAGCDARFRGPGFDPFAVSQGSFFTCIGAAQTHGPLIEKPFPNLLAERTGLNALNLGMGGAGPGFFLINPSLIEAANRGRFVIVQAMAARHEENSRYAPDGYVEFVRDRIRGDSIDSGIAWARLIDEDFDSLPRYVAETRATWLETSRRLIAALKVPVIFFWFARREPDYTIDWAAVRELKHSGASSAQITNAIFADVPQLVDGPTFRAASTYCKLNAHCTSTRGTGAVLTNRHTGLPINGDAYRNKGVEYRPLVGGRNLYYPSKEMHEDAADALEPYVRRLLV